MNDLAKNLLTWAIIAIVLVSIFNHYANVGSVPDPLSYSEFLNNVRNGQVSQVHIQSNDSGNNISGRSVDGSDFKTFGPPDPKLVDDLVQNKIEITAEPPAERSVLVDLILGVAPILLLIGVWVYFMRQMQGGGAGRGAMSFGKSRAKLQGEDQVKVTFADVAGVEEAKEEVGELVEFLRNPGKFQKLGGHIPRGVLMVGSPGTGKTLLARAIAGEAKVPFFAISGSDFVEMFVGVGASRVRDMFDQAKKHAPCIIFIDEIDAVGRHRGAGLGGGHDEREQTLNQLLVEMDGFEGGEGVIVIAATNRPDVLDPALLRPGRFDRQVVVPLPDIRGREAILKVHMRKVPLSDDIDARVIARGTPGFSGADLANLVNEGALFAARDNAKEVTMDHLDRAKDKIMMGAERRSMVMSEKEKRLTAYHEAGHAIVGRVVPEHDPVYKVTIIPRGMALGVTMQLPVDDRHTYTREYILGSIAVALGGRVAEEIFLEHMTTGAGSDLVKSTDMARRMVCEYGMSDEMGPLTYGHKGEQVFLGRDYGHVKEYSEDTSQRIDQEVQRIISEQYKLAHRLLEENRPVMVAMAEALLEREILDADQIAAIVRGETLPPLAGKPAATENTSDQTGTAAPDQQPEKDKGNHAPLSGPVGQPG